MAPDSKTEIGLPPGESLSRDALVRDGLRGAIEEILQAASGQKLALKVSLKDGLTVPEPPAAEIEDLPEEPAPPAAEQAPQASAGDPAADGAAGGEDIHNDPLIKDALRIFEAEIQ